MNEAVPTAQDVEAAAERIRPQVHRTPVLTSTTLDRACGHQVLLKCENFQRTGAFKARGAFNALLRLSPQQRERGVVACSSGNHAQAVACAARDLGVAATILMPGDAATLKADAVRGYGATVQLFDRYADDRAALAEKIAASSGATVIPPFDHPDIIAGQGTVAAELWEGLAGIDGVEDLDVFLAPVSGGGLLSGCALAARARNPGVRIVGVEPESGDDTKRSLEAGARVAGAVPRTVADGLGATSPGVHPFTILQQVSAEIVLVSEEAIVRAVRWLFERTKLVVEPSGAAGVAALLDGLIPGRQRVGAVLTGGNVSADAFAELMQAQPV